MLALFAAQAAAMVANARTHREERRARADLEALVETSPIGVVVFDAATRAPVSFNREARRIVAELATPGRPLEALAGEVTCRRGDGNELTLDDLGRAEAVELSVRDGRSVRTLLDATPIHSEGGAVERVVVTLQGLAPFEALARARAEFLGQVSHELRAPLAAIKGSAATARGAAADLDPAGSVANVTKGRSKPGRRTCSTHASALARRFCSHPMASVRTHGPTPKARSTILASPTMPPCSAKTRAWPLRNARMTSKPLIVA